MRARVRVLASCLCVCAGGLWRRVGALERGGAGRLCVWPHLRLRWLVPPSSLAALFFWKGVGGADIRHGSARHAMRVKAGPASVVPHVGLGQGMSQLGLDLKPTMPLYSVCDDLGIKPSLRGHIRRGEIKSGLVCTQFKSFDGDNPNFLLA